MTDSTQTIDPVINYKTFGLERPSFQCQQDLPYRRFMLSAHRFRQRTAIVTDESKLTYEELLQLVDRLASGFRALGVAHGEGVAFLVGNDWRQLPAFLAVAKIGAAFMTVSRYLTEDEIQYQLGVFKPRLIVGDSGYSFDDILQSAMDDVALEAEEGDIASGRFSSGTTGRPKMMLGSQRSVTSTVVELAFELGLKESDRQLVVGPLAHAALYVAISQLLVGGTIFIKGAFDASNFWEECNQHQITNVMVVPTMISAVIGQEGACSSLRIMLSLGSSLAPVLKEKLATEHPEIDLYELYGASEIGMVTMLRPDEHEAHPDSVGKAAMGAEIMIADDEGQPLPPGEIGNIYARGPQLIVRYVGPVVPESAPPHLAEEGWLCCGDLGHLDADGFLYISDRRSDLILSGGLNIYPAEVERVLMQLDGVLNVAVVGLPDDHWGQVVAAYVEGSFDSEKAERLCREHLSSYKVPRLYFSVDSLPQTNTGKISRKMVRDAVENGALPSE